MGETYALISLSLLKLYDTFSPSIVFKEKCPRWFYVWVMAHTIQNKRTLKEVFNEVRRVPT